MCCTALDRIVSEMKATRLNITVHNLNLSDPSGLDERVDAVQMGISVLSLPEELGKPIDLGKRKGRPADHKMPGSGLELVTYSADAKGDEKKKIDRNVYDLLSRLDALPESEQAITLTLYGLDRARKHNLPEDKLILGTLKLPISELTGDGKSSGGARASFDPARPAAKSGGGDLDKAQKALQPPPEGSTPGRGGRRGGGKSVGTLTLSASVQSALKWLKDAEADGGGGSKGSSSPSRRPGDPARSSDPARPYGRDDKYTSSSRDNERGRSREPENDRYGRESSRDERVRSREPEGRPSSTSTSGGLLPSPIAGRQKLGLNTLASTLTLGLQPMSYGERAGLLDPQSGGLTQLDGAGYTVELEDVSFPVLAESSLGRDALITRHSIRAALVEVSTGSSSSSSSRYDPARPSSAPAGGSSPTYSFLTNCLTLDAEYDSRSSTWRLANNSRVVLVRPGSSMPKDAQLLLELTLTVSKPDKNATAAEEPPTPSRRGARGGGRSSEPPCGGPRTETVLIAGWAQLALSTISQAGSGGGGGSSSYDPARSSRGGADPNQYLSIKGGSIFRPRELQSAGDTSSSSSSRGGRSNRVAPGGGGGGATMSVRIGSLQYEERTPASYLPQGVVVPIDALQLVSSYRKLIASPPEGEKSLTRDAQMNVVCSAGEQIAASAGFAALADAPDSLSTWSRLYATSLEDAERRGGRDSRGGGGGRFDPARPNQGSRGGGGRLDEREQVRGRAQQQHSPTLCHQPPRSHGPPPPLPLPPSLFSQLRVLKEILLFAPLLGRSRTSLHTTASRRSTRTTGATPSSRWPTAARPTARCSCCARTRR